jgi:hypothetical protein
LTFLPDGSAAAKDTVVALNALATYAISAGQSVDVALEAMSTSPWLSRNMVF